MGFEPTRPFRAYSLSRGAPSTARPRLRGPSYRRESRETRLKFLVESRRVAARCQRTDFAQASDGRNWATIRLRANDMRPRPAARRPKECELRPQTSTFGPQKAAPAPALIPRTGSAAPDGTPPVSRTPAPPPARAGDLRYWTSRSGGDGTDTRGPRTSSRTAQRRGGCRPCRTRRPAAALALMPSRPGRRSAPARCRRRSPVPHQSRPP